MSSLDAEAARSEVMRKVAELPPAVRKALKSKNIDEIRDALAKRETDQRRIFAKAIAAHISGSRKGDTPKKLEFARDPTTGYWIQKEGGPSKLTFRMSKSQRHIMVPEALEMATRDKPPGGWEWGESKSAALSPEGAYMQFMIELSKKEEEGKRQKPEPSKPKDDYSTIGCKFEPGDGGYVFVRVEAEPEDSFVVPIVVKSSGAKFKQRDGRLFLEMDGRDYGVALESPRTYFETMDAYVRHAELSIDRWVKKSGNIVLPYPNNNYTLIAAVSGTQFYGMGVVRERVDDDAGNDLYEVEPQGVLHEKIRGPNGGEFCKASDNPDFAAETCKGSTLYLERTGFTRRPGGRPPGVVTGAAEGELLRWRVAQMFGRRSENVEFSNEQIHCYAAEWQRIRIHYSIDFATVRAAENFNAAAGHLTLELGTWEWGNNKFYRYWFNTGMVARPAAGADWAYERYKERYPNTPLSFAAFRSAVEGGLANIGAQFRATHGF